MNRACRRSGSTPLHRAVTSTGAPGTAGRRAEARQIVEMLLAAGADPALRDMRRETAAERATDVAIVALLAEATKAAEPSAATDRR